MCNGLCGGAAALVTVCRALRGKQRGKHFSKPGRAKKKEFKPQSLQDLFIKSTCFCYEGDTWLWKIQSCFVQRANSSSVSLSLQREWKTSRSCFSLLQGSHGFLHQLRSDVIVHVEPPCARWGNAAWGTRAKSEGVWEHSLAMLALENLWIASIRDACGVFEYPLSEERMNPL